MPKRNGLANGTLYSNTLVVPGLPMRVMVFSVESNIPCSNLDSSTMALVLDVGPILVFQGSISGAIERAK